MLGYDIAKLEKVSEFADFLEIVSNPTALAKTLEELKSAIADAKTVLQVTATVDAADKYKQDAEAVLNERYNALTAKEENFKVAKAEFEAQVQKKTAELKELEKETREKYREATTIVTKAQEAQAIIDADRVAVNEARKVVDAQRETLVEQMRVLKEKEDRLKEVLG